MVAVGEALHRRDDHLRVQLLDALPGEAHAVERAGAEVLDQHVAFADQRLEHLLALGLLGVQCQRALVAVEHREVQRVGIGNVTQLGAGDVARAGALDLDHVRAEPGQELRTGGAGLHVGEVDDLDAVEWFGAHMSAPWWLVGE
jgi:hypothetical protein